MDEEENQCEYLEEEMVPLKKWVLRDGKSIGERGLKIKFTLGKGNSSEGSEEGLVGPEPEQDPEPGSRSRVCKVCKKVFSSGRALGGHMRVHNNQVEDDEFLGNKPNLKLNKFKTPITNLSFLHPNNADYSCQNSDGTATCAICDKVFPSLKSLFGHMRCHPDRDWRGVQPPTTGNNSSSSTVTEQKMEDLIESTTTIRSSCPNQVPSLPSWSVTGKRGRTNGGPEAKAAYELMMLSRGEGSVAGNKDLGSKKMKKEEKRNVFDEKPVWSNGTEEESSDDEDEEEEEPVSKYTDYNKYPVGPDVRKRIRMKKFRDIETMQNMGVNVTVYKQSHSHTTPDRFKCTTCDKSFPTHQALGGHRSSHYKGKACQTEEGEQQYEVLPMIPSNFTQLIDPTELHGFGSTAATVRTTHRCRICNRTFPTGQALGGHKRCHWTAPTDTLASTGTGRRMLDFDLNEPANIEDVEQGMKQPDDYASSS